MMKSRSAIVSLWMASLQTSGVRSFSAFPAAPIVTKDPIPASTALEMEATVRRYFEGVHTKNPEMIRSCFAETASIRDVCGGLQNSSQAARTVAADVLVERCMDFVTAHPDCAIDFYYGPECGRSSDGWVVAHWYERGTWTGESRGLTPQHTPMAVEGQTRFLVDPVDFKIKEFVVTRTFTEWEMAFLQQQKAVADAAEEKSSS